MSMKSFCRFVAFTLTVVGAGGLCAEDVPDAPVEYVESDGRQWVETDVDARCDTQVEMSVEWLSFDDDLILAGSRKGDQRLYFLNNSFESRIGYGYGTFEKVTRREGESEGEKLHECQWEKERTYQVVTEFSKSGEGASKLVMHFDGAGDATKFVDRTTNVVIDTGLPLYLFACNYDGTASNHARVRLYGLKIWQKPNDGSGADYRLLHDYRPCVKGGRPGLFDEVTKTISYSASGTDLIAGPDPNVPDLFVDYVESDGNQYVDLGVTGKSGLRMESKMMWVTVPGDGTFVASRQGQNDRFYLYHHYQKHTIGYYSYQNGCGKAAQANVEYTIETTLKNGAQTLVVNGENMYSLADSRDIDTGLNLYLFACNKDGSAQYASSARCYSLKLWTIDANGAETPVRDFRPCLRKGRAGLYDAVSKRIFYPGKGELKAPQLKTAGKPDYFIGYLESRGWSHIDTGVRARSGTRAAGSFCLTQERQLLDEKYTYLEDTVGRTERTFLGACGEQGGGRRFYLVHASANTLWMGYNDLRVYPEKVTTDPETGVVRTNRLWLTAKTPQAFDVTLEAGRQSVALNGTVYHESSDASTVDTGCNLFLFAVDRAGKPDFKANARCYELKIWQTDANGAYQLVRDFRPCVKDGLGGVYDACHDEIYYPNFPAGPDCWGDAIYTDEMKPAKTVEYVESDGTLWIDTGVIGRTNTVAEFDMAWMRAGESLDVGFLGSRKDDSDTRFYLWHDAHDCLSFGYGTFAYFVNGQTVPGWRSAETSVKVEVGKKYHVKTTYAAHQQVIEVDGTLWLSYDYETKSPKEIPESIDTGLPMYLFGYNVKGSPGCLCAARCYGLKIWQDGELVRNYIPVLLDSGLPALWDKVSKKPFYPANGKHFSAVGPVTGDWVEKIPFILLVR